VKKLHDVEMLGILARGVAMGIADIVPGISGSTIALITGIYDRMIKALASFSAASATMLFRKGWRVFSTHHDIVFLCVLLVGMMLSQLVLANVIRFLLDTAPLYVWGFFFGLVAAAVIQIGSRVKLRILAVAGISGLFLGGTFAFLPAQTTELWLPLVFVGGILAVTAWMLPGISGSLVLVILGLYGPMLEALTSLDLIPLLTFGLGLVAGLVAFARFIQYLFRHYRDVILGFLTGLMAGSLMVLWPWRIGTDLLWPTDYAMGPPWVGVAGMMALGMATVFMLVFASRRVD
jgi:putative membrane protein